MLRIHPFAALHPQPNLAVRVASVPYDVVDAAEARALAAGNSISFLHVVRPEIDLPEGTDPHDDAVYATARENFDRFVRDGILLREAEPRLYIYRLVSDHRAQLGLACCCHVDDYERNLIRKHEKTRPDKEDDRTRHVMTLNANAGPVFLTYRDRGEIDLLIERDRNRRPLFHFDAPDGVTHTVWTVPDPRPYVEAFERVPCAYVADGHHRAASAARAGAERRAANPGHRGDEEYNWFLAALFPASHLRILPYHRLIRDLGGRGADDVLAALRAIGTLEDARPPFPAPPRRCAGGGGRGTGEFHLYLAGRWHRLRLEPDAPGAEDAVESLDVAQLQSRVLEPVFGIGDPRTDPRLDFVGGIRGTDSLARRVDAGEAAAAVAMHATTIEELLDVADAGRIMPPKSTWFEPKLRSGLLVHTLD